MEKLLKIFLLFLPLTFLATSTLADRPNVVFILVDDMGYGDIGPFGVTDIKTPHLDRLAREGVKLTDSYAAGSVCSPTRVAFLTGRYQHRVGMEWANYWIGSDKGLSTSEISIARMLKNNGYATGIIGKWHVGGTVEIAPNAHGFDQFFGFLGPNVDFYTHQEVIPMTGVPDLWENTKPVKAEGYMTDLITEHSVTFITNHARKPFFLFVSYNAPHWPFQPPDRRWVAKPENYLEGTRRDYNRMVERIDDGIGEILQTLDEKKLGENTLVIFTSDNGGERLSRNAPFFHHKATLWEGGIRVPSLIRWPKQIPAGTTSKQANITMDMTATILAVTGTKPPDGRLLDGIDILPIIKGEKPIQERTFFWRLPLMPNENCTPTHSNFQCQLQKAVRKGNWKYVLDGYEKLEFLFDLETDPGEKQTLAYKHPEIVRELRDLMKQWEKDVPIIQNVK